ncbi:MAG TPA: globin domain-containing protein [Vicinamibacterales bacterium]|nr:globin domain-containing protein [Vicinamibacterales bacterium]
MTPDAIEQVRQSYTRLTAAERQLSAGFYDRLFTAAPNLRRLFPENLSTLQGHFEAAIALVIRNLNDMDALKEPLRDLGAQHVHWGARPEDYLTARDALVGAIGACSPDWSPELESHWRDAITAIIVPMIEGAAVYHALEAERISAEL